MWHIFKVVFLLLLGITPVLAQTTACPNIVEAALVAVEQNCQLTGRNQACLGHLSLEASPQPGSSNFRFEQMGDITNVIDIQHLHLSAMDVATDEWGVVLMRLQANLPDSLPGQNVTFLLFGNVELINNVTPGSSNDAPMQAFYLATGMGDAQCAEAPESGLIVQTPAGVGEVTFNVNGVDVSMGSTVQFQAQRGGQMRVRTLEGAASLTLNGESRPVLAGTQVEFPVNDDLLAQGLPELPEPYSEDGLGVLPLEVLARDIEIHPPLSDAEIGIVYNLIEQDAPLCADDSIFLPSCDHLPQDFGGLPCTFDPDTYPERALCSAAESTFEDMPLVDAADPLINPEFVAADTRECIYPLSLETPALPANETRPFCDDAQDTSSTSVSDNPSELIPGQLLPAP